MKVLGLTGGMASGKSVIAAYLHTLGAPVFDADACCRQVVLPGTPGLEQVAAVLGPECLTAQGALNRARVAERIFVDADLRRQLEQVMHALVWQCLLAFMQQAQAAGAPAVVLDVPLLIESGWYKKVDAVWVVSVTQQTQLARARQRDGLSEAQVKARLAVQMPLAEKVKFADLVIDNNGSLKDTKERVKSAWSNFVTATCTKHAWTGKGFCCTGE